MLKRYCVLLLSLLLLAALALPALAQEDSTAEPDAQATEAATDSTDLPGPAMLPFAAEESQVALEYPAAWLLVADEQLPIVLLATDESLIAEFDASSSDPSALNLVPGPEEYRLLLMVFPNTFLGYLGIDLFSDPSLDRAAQNLVRFLYVTTPSDPPAAPEVSEAELLTLPDGSNVGAVRVAEAQQQGILLLRQLQPGLLLVGVGVSAPGGLEAFLEPTLATLGSFSYSGSENALMTLLMESAE